MSILAKRLAYIMFIGIGVLSLNLRAQEKTNNESNQQAEEELLVEVEPTYVLPPGLAVSQYLVPYRLRRSKWGSLFSFSYSQFHPIGYRPNVYEDTFDTVYGSAELPLLELQLGTMRNFDLAAIGLNLSIGTYSNDSDEGVLAGANLNLIPIRAGARITFNNLFLEPYFAPYAEAGGYTVLFNETLDSTAHKGNTAVAPYALVGVHLQLDWLDQYSASQAYTEAGIENTFIFIEGRKYFISTAAADNDFETDLHIAGGVALEF